MLPALKVLGDSRHVRRGKQNPDLVDKRRRRAGATELRGRRATWVSNRHDGEKQIALETWGARFSGFSAALSNVPRTCCSRAALRATDPRASLDGDVTPKRAVRRM